MHSQSVRKRYFPSVEKNAPIWCIFFCRWAGAGFITVCKDFTRPSNIKGGRLLKKQILLLIELQKNDSEIKRIKIRNEELPDKIVKLDAEFRDIERKVEEERERFEELNSAQRKKEESLKRGIESLKKTRDRLLEVKTNKEYHAMLKEIEVTEEKNSKIEDEIIYVLEEIDRVREGLKTSEDELIAYRLKYEKEKTKIDEEMNSVDSELLASQKKIDNVREKIDTDIFERYEIIKARRNGLAVVSVWNGTCSGCHVNVPPQMYNELQRSEDLMLCPNCNRIIYWNDIGK